MKGNSMKHLKLKNIGIVILFILFSMSALAQEKQKNEPPKKTRVIADQDTIEIKKGKRKKKVKLTFYMGEEKMDIVKDSTLKMVNKEEEDCDDDDYEKSEIKYPNLFAGITFSRFDFGLAKLIDNGKATLSPENEFLDYRAWKSTNIGFDVAQIGYKFGDQFRIILSAGFDWTHFRLNENVILERNTKPLSYEYSNIDYKKNRFSSTYLRIPLTFEIKSKRNAFPERLRFAAGPIAGVLMKGSQKFKSEEEGKRKVSDDFNLAPFRYGAFARAGYGGFGIYAKYYINDMFQNSPDQEGLKNLSIGLMLFF